MTISSNNQALPSGSRDADPHEGKPWKAAPFRARALARVWRMAVAAPLWCLQRRADVAIVAFSLMLIAVVWLTAFMHSQTEREHAVEDAIRHNSNLAKAFEGHSVQTLKSVDSALLLLKHEYARFGVGTHIAQYMEAGIISNNLFKTINIADEHGKVLLASEPAHLASVQDYEYFTIHMRSGAGQPYIGRPVQNPFSLTWAIPFSRRIDKADGSFGGVITAMVDPAYFTDFYRQADLGQNGMVGLIGFDGIARARQSGISPTPSRDMTGTRLLKARAESPNGSYVTSGITDGIPRFLSYRTLQDYPLIVEVGTSRDEILAEIALQRRIDVWAAALVSVAVILFAGLLLTASTRRKRALAALASSKAQFRATFNQAAIGIAHIAPDGTLLRVNQKLCAMLGYARHELLQIKSFELDHPGTRDQHGAPQAQLIAGEIATYAAEGRLLCKDGSVIWVNRTVSLVRGPGGAPQYFITVVEDVTDRRNSEQRFHATFEQAAVGLAHIGLDERRHLLVNQKLCGMLGYTRDELLAMRSDAMLHADDLEKCRAQRAGLLSGGADTAACELRYICRDGRVIWVNRTVSVARGDAGQPLYLIRVTEDISERKEAEQQFRASYDQSAVGIAYVAPDGRYLRANAQFCAMVGYSETELMQTTFRQITHPDHHDDGGNLLRRLYDGELDSGSLEKRYLHRDGSTVWVDMSLSIVRGADRKAKYHIAMVTDISGRKAQEQKIARLNRIRAVLGGINALIVRARDREALFGEACRIVVEDGNFGVAWLGMLDRETLDVVPSACAGIAMERLNTVVCTARADLPNGRGVVGRAIRAGTAVFDNDICADPDIGSGRRLALELGYSSIVALPLLLANSVVGVLTLCSPDKDFFNEEELRLLNQLAGDISFALEHISQAEKLNHLAYYDALTGLPNRVLFQDLLKQTIAQSRRSHGIVGVLFLDLDGFKVINDTLGHVVGDKMLQMTASRLLECVREGDRVARFGGDEFAVMLSDLAEAQDGSLVAQKILDAFALPFDLDGNETYVSASIGIALCPLDSEDADILIKSADAAMYGAKAAGRNNYQFYIAEMNSNASKKMQLGTRLRRALERQEFVLHYQPKIELNGGKIVGVEALMRWQPPGEAMVSPAEFIPLLEETGLIVQAGEWALRAACAQIREWQRSGVEPVPVAINLSGRQFQQAGLERQIRGILDEFAIEPRWIELEITESMLMRNPDAAIAVLANLKALGIRISVDDFGTGYSSLAYLKRFPLDALKVDRSFVRDIPADTDDTAIARAVITMAHHLNLKVIAEGVETREQVAFLRNNRCDQGQGYLFARPLAAPDCTALLAGSRRSDKIEAEGERNQAPAVLLVDDDEDCLALMQTCLLPDGYRILTAANGRQALERLALEDVSVVVSDENMPGMAGVELLSRVKNMYPHIARIMMTGNTDFGVAAKAINESEVCKLFVKERDDHLLRNEVRKAFWARSRASNAADWQRTGTDS